MNIEGFGMLVLEQLPFEPTDQQVALVAALSRFCSAYMPQDSVFILNGYAGTGKTSVMGALVRSLNKIGITTQLMASTGRAAKVFSNFTGLPAYTIHRKIYKAPVFTAEGRWVSRVAENPHVNTVFIVDEASMIGDGTTDGGSSLLSDLIFYVYSGINCKLILLGDTAQLPPVGMEESPAMNPEVLKQMGLHVTRAVMTKTVRQKRRSGILYNATQMRRALKHPDQLPEPELKVSAFSDVSVIQPEDLEDMLRRSVAEYGENGTLLITRSNRRAADFNKAIRQTIYEREETICTGERLIISKNNYFWTRPTVVQASGGNINEMSEAHRPMDFIANGDTAIVEHVFATDHHAGMLFADVRLSFPDHDWRVVAKINLDALIAETPDLPFEKRQALYLQALYDAGVPENAAPTTIRNVLKADAYYNALQVKYGYAVTCHKAQGGQWPSVFVDMGYIPAEAYKTIDFYRWLYTATTRATTRLSFVNPSLNIT